MPKQSQSWILLAKAAKFVDALTLRECWGIFAVAAVGAYMIADPFGWLSLQDELHGVCFGHGSVRPKDFAFDGGPCGELLKVGLFHHAIGIGSILAAIFLVLRKPK